MLLSIIASVSIWLTIIINVFANIIPYNNQTTGEISDKFQVFFVPSGYVFAIWGVIYIFLIAFSVYSLQPSQKNNAVLQKIMPAVIIGSIANSAWIFLWHYNHPVWCLIPMFILLGSLIYTYLTLNIGKKAVGKLERFAVNTTFSIYLGWITVATIANITDALWAKGWNGFGISGEIWAALLIVIAGVIAAVIMYKRKDFAFNLVIIWAITGIAVKFPNVMVIVGSVIVSLIIIAGTMIWKYVLKK